MRPLHMHPLAVVRTPVVARAHPPTVEVEEEVAHDLQPRDRTAIWGFRWSGEGGLVDGGARRPFDVQQMQWPDHFDGSARGVVVGVVVGSVTIFFGLSLVVRTAGHVGDEFAVEVGSKC